MPGHNDVLTRLFGGTFDPRLTPEENLRLSRSAQVRAGAAGLIAAQEGRGLFGAIGAAAEAGATTKQELIDKLFEQDLAEKQAAGKLRTSVTTLPNGDMVLLDLDTGDTIAELGKGIADPKVIAEPVPVELGNKDIVFGSWDPQLGVWRGPNGEILVGARPVSDPERGVAMDFVDSQGRNVRAFIDPTNNRQIGFARLIPESGADQDQEKEMLANALGRDVGAMKDLLADRNNKPFGLIEVAAAKNDFTRGLTSTEVQQFIAASQNVLSLIVRARSGARATDAEVRRLELFAIPNVGDDPVTVISKFDRIDDIVEDIRAGRDPLDRAPLVDEDGEEVNQMEHLVPN